MHYYMIISAGFGARGQTKNMEFHRRWLKDSIRKEVDWGATGQSRGLPPPPAREPIPHAAECGHR